MTESEIISIERACQRLAAECSYFGDHGLVEEYANLYLEDGFFTRPGVEARGRNAIRKHLDNRPRHIRTRHISSDVIVTVLTADEATGRGSQLFIMHDTISGVTAAPVAADFEDRYLRTSMGWRIAERRASPAF